MWTVQNCNCVLFDWLDLRLNSQNFYSGEYSRSNTFLKLRVSSRLYWHISTSYLFFYCSRFTSLRLCGHTSTDSFCLNYDVWYSTFLQNARFSVFCGFLSHSKTIFILDSDIRKVRNPRIRFWDPSDKTAFHQTVAAVVNGYLISSLFVRSFFDTSAARGQSGYSLWDPFKRECQLVVWVRRSSVSLLSFYRAMDIGYKKRNINEMCDEMFLLGTFTMRKNIKTSRFKDSNIVGSQIKLVRFRSHYVYASSLEAGLLISLHRWYGREKLFSCSSWKSFDY